MPNQKGQEIKKTLAKEIDDLRAPTWGRRADFLSEPLWSEVLPGLWQGGTDDWDVNDAKIFGKKYVPRITKRDFDTVITLYAAAKPVDWHVRELRFGMWDSNMEDIELDEVFDLVQMAHSDWLRGKKVLIRCQAGWNRSGLIMALVLIREGYAPAEAIRMIRENRSKNALCNPAFVNWLLDECKPEEWRGDFLGDPLSWSIIAE